MIGNYAMVVSVDSTNTLDKTFVEIETAVKQGMIVTIMAKTETFCAVSFVTGVARATATMFLVSTNDSKNYVAEDLNDYPVYQESQGG